MTTLPARLLVLKQLAVAMVRDAVPATKSAQTCFVPKYQMDALAALIGDIDEAAAALSVPEGREAVAFWHDGDGRAISDAEKTRSCRGDVEGYRYPLYTTPQPGDGVVQELNALRQMTKRLISACSVVPKGSVSAALIMEMITDAANASGDTAAPSAKGVA